MTSEEKIQTVLPALSENFAILEHSKNLLEITQAKLFSTALDLYIEKFSGSASSSSTTASFNHTKLLEAVQKELDLRDDVPVELLRQDFRCTIS